MKPFDTAKYRRQQQLYGQPVRWWKALPCECVNPITGQRDAACVLCEKDGHRYEEQQVPDGYDGQPARVLPYETTTAQKDEEFGLIQVGQTAVSVMPDEFDLARKDWLALLEMQELARQIVARGGGDVDTLPYRSVAKVSAITQGAGESLELYTPGVDWELQGESVRWLSGHRPAEGTRYSVQLWFNPLWVCVNLDTKMQGMGSDDKPLPREWILVLKP